MEREAETGRVFRESTDNKQSLARSPAYPPRRVGIARGSQGGSRVSRQRSEPRQSERSRIHPIRPHAIHHLRLAPGSPAHAHIDDRRSTIDTSPYASVDSPPRRHSSPAPEQTPTPSASSAAAPSFDSKATPGVRKSQAQDAPQHRRTPTKKHKKRRRRLPPQK